MKKVFPWLLLAAACWGGYSYYKNRSSQSQVQASEEPQEEEAKPDVQDGPIQPNTIVSPLETFMEKATSLHKTFAPTPLRKPNPSDHIAPSPVGTSTAVVHKTFAVTSSAKFSFQVPPHAASPRLRGSYRSFAQQSGVQSSDESADIELLLMNDQQYADFLHGGTPDVVYSVDSSHDQDVSFGLPATMSQPAQYYLVFSNSASRAAKKVVEADFRVDF
jgi:hypothetical protein